MKQMKKVWSVVVCIVMIAGLLPVLETVDTKADTITRYEAEDGDISHAQSINTSVTNASGGKGVVCRPSQYLTMTVSVSEAGDYTIPIRYATGSNMNWDVIPVEITVNEGSVVNQDFANTGTSTTTNGWNTFATQEVTLSLQAGENVIVLKNNSEGDATVTTKFITFDYIEVTDPITVTYPEAIGRHEAEDAISFTQGSADNPASISENENFSGGKYVGNMNTWPNDGRAYCTTKVNASEAGTYKMTIGYAGGEENHPCNIDVRINNGSWISTEAPVTAWNVVGTISLTVELTEGINTIDVTGACNIWYEGMGWEWINLDYFELEKAEVPVEYPKAIGRHEAENAQNLGGNSVQSGDYYAACSNSAVVGVGWTWINNDKKYIMWAVEAEEAGVYEVTLSYCAPKVSEFLIQINDNDWVPFDDEMDVVGKVAPATGTWNTTASIKTKVKLTEGVNTISVSGPVLDNSTGEGNFFTVYGEDINNISSANIDCIDIAKYTEPIGPVVTVDGLPVQVSENKVTLGNAAYGYLCDGKMYAPNTEVTVEGDMAFTSVNELSVTMANGAGIRYIGSAGIRFQSTILSDNMDAVASNAITEGTLITANDIYEAKGTDLTLTSDYTKLDVVNSGWYQDTVGTYCGSICDVVESNYIRNFTARAYVTINYENSDAVTVYSSMGPVRSISQVASAVKAAGYAGIAEEYKSTIDSFIK